MEVGTLSTGQGLLHRLWSCLLGVQALWWLDRQHGQLLRTAFRAPSEPLQRWSATIWPLQWRMALSTAGGYRIRHLHSIASMGSGAVDAGRLGMTFALINAVYTVSHGLIQARQPALAMAAVAESSFNFIPCSLPGLNGSWVCIRWAVVL